MGEFFGRKSLLVLYLNFIKTYSFSSNAAHQIQAIDSGHRVFLLSMNFENCQLEGQNLAAIKMASSHNLQFPRCIHAFKMEQHSSSVQHKRNLAAQNLVVDYELFNQLQQNNDRSNNLGLVKQQLNPGRPITIKLNSVKFYPRLASKRHYRSKRNPRDRKISMELVGKQNIFNVEKISGNRQEGTGNSQSIALQSWASYPQHVATTEQSTTALSPIAVAKVHIRDDKHDRSDMLNGVNHPWSQASCSTMSRQRSTMHLPGATGEEGHDS